MTELKTAVSRSRGMGYGPRRESRVPAAPADRGVGDDAGLLEGHAGSATLRAGKGQNGEFHLYIVRQELVVVRGLQDAEYITRSNK
jgi:hypothetical protein